MTFKRLHSILLITIIGIVLIAICYNFVDKPVADFAFHHHLQRFIWLKWLTYLAPAFIVICFLSILFSIFRLFSHINISYTEYAVFIASCNTLVTEQFKSVLKYVFGRTWPSTWVNNNPSWLQNHVYGFHFFHGGAGYASFPSGHTTAIVAFVAVLWFSIPKLRWIYVLALIGITVGLLGMYYHFVSDILGGALLGFISGSLSYQSFLSERTAVRLSKHLGRLKN